MKYGAVKLVLFPKYMQVPLTVLENIKEYLDIDFKQTQ